MTEFEKIAKLDRAIWRAYFTSDVTDAEIPTDYRSYLWLQEDLGKIAAKAAKEEFDDLVHRFIDSHPLVNKIREKVDFTKIEVSASIRKDWASALRNVRKGNSLSSKIGWGFSEADIKELAKLHRENKFRKKIEDLLEDCNYHAECGEFSEGIYTCLN